MVTTHAIDLVLGDVNINHFSCKDVEPLTSMMESLHYTQIVQRPTFLSGGLLNYVYIKHANKSFKIRSTPSFRPLTTKNSLTSTLNPPIHVTFSMILIT